MQPWEIHLKDWPRILVGEVPASFYIELVIRAVAVYLLLMISMRLMGKRMSGLLNRNELAALSSLAAAVGVPLGAPDRGILPAFIIAFIVIYVERWVTYIAFKNNRFERLALGNIDILVKDSVIDMKALRKTRITPERLKAQLRSQGIKHLGAVKRMYMEANGSFTIIKEKQAKAGLQILPVWDKDFYATMKQCDELACGNCGMLKEDPDTNAVCPNCRAREWEPAVL
ncbi:MAG TPA: YetF domain-containing protein [Mucilaginibacter sp.]